MKNTKKYENVAPRLQKDFQNGGKSGPRMCFFRLWPILDFVQHYKGFVWFSWFWATPGRPKNDKKTLQKKERQKSRAKTDFLQKNAKMEPKMNSDLDHEFSPNSPPRGHYSDLGPKGAQKEPKGAKRVPKDPKTAQKGAKRVPKRCQKGAKEVWNLYLKLK